MITPTNITKTSVTPKGESKSSLISPYNVAKIKIGITYYVTDVDDFLITDTGDFLVYSLTGSITNQVKS